VVIECVRIYCINMSSLMVCNEDMPMISNVEICSRSPPEHHLPAYVAFRKLSLNKTESVSVGKLQAGASRHIIIWEILQLCWPT
jgi:hypothetical protein